MAACTPPRSVNWHSLLEMTYQMITRTDDETMRFLDDVILLMPDAESGWR
jgi:hypothetical protein